MAEKKNIEYGLKYHHKYYIVSFIRAGIMICSLLYPRAWKDAWHTVGMQELLVKWIILTFSVVIVIVVFVLSCLILLFLGPFKVPYHT